MDEPSNATRDAGGEALAGVFSAPVVLLGLLGRQRVAVSVARDRTEVMLWRFQFSHRAILRMTDTGEWAWLR